MEAVQYQRVANGGSYNMEVVNGLLQGVKFTPQAQTIPTEQATIANGIIASHILLGSESVEWRASLVHPTGEMLAMTVIAPSGDREEALETLGHSVEFGVFLAVGFRLQNIWIPE